MNAAGVYEIVCAESDERYIGSTVCFRERWAEHRRMLRAGVHHSVALQSAWVLRGADAFEFRPLLVCEPSRDALIDYEQRALDALRPEYNVAKTAGGGITRAWTAEERAVCADRMRGNAYSKGVKHTPEARAAMGAGKVGKRRKPFSDEHRAKIALSKRGHNGCAGRKLSGETRDRIAASLRGRTLPTERFAHRCKLSADDVRDARERAARGEAHAGIAKTFGVSRQTITKVINRSKYRWVT